MSLPSPYLKMFHRIMKVGTSFNPDGQLNYYYLLLVTLASTVVILCDFAGSLELGVRNEVFHGKTYETGMFIFLVLHIPILIRKRVNLSELIDLLLDPFNEISVSSEVDKIAQDFIKWTNIIGTIVFFNDVFVINFCMMVLGPLGNLLIIPVNSSVQSLPLPVGRIPFQTDSYFVYATFYVVSAFAVLTTCAFHSSWYLLFIYSTLKIKARLRMIASTIETLDEQAAIRCMVLTEISQIIRHRSPINEENMLFKCTEDILAEVICEHIKIMRYIRLVNSTFSLSLMVFIEGAITMCAILLQQITDVFQPTIQDYLVKVNVAFAGLFFIWVFSVCGQSIATESTNFFSSLYNHDWTNKPLKLQHSITLMMTVATNPLKITAGRIYPLTMVFYVTTVRAVYSNINILITLKKQTKSEGN